MIPVLLVMAAFQPPEGVEKVTAPKDVVAVVAADLAALPEHDRLFMRYVWLPPWIETNSAARAVVFTANTTSRASILVDAFATDVYIRYDLRELVDDHSKDLVEFMRVWDQIALLDSRFYAGVEILVGVDAKFSKQRSAFLVPRVCQAVQVDSVRFIVQMLAMPDSISCSKGGR